MKILHVITGLDTGGAETALCRLLESETQRTWEHSVVALGIEAALSDRVRQAGARLSHLSMKRGRPNPLVLRRLRAILRAERPAVIQGWMYHANLAATWSAVGLGVPVLWGIRHSLYDLSREKRLTRAAIRTGIWFSGYSRAVIYNARASAKQHEALGYRRDKTQIIPNGFDTGEFRPDRERRARVRASLRIPDDAFVIGLVARWHPMKHHENFFRAAAMFAQAYPQAVFVLAGEGVDGENKALAEWIRSLGVTHHVRLCGRRDDISAIDAALDIASSSSAWGEAFPNALGEAMACGVPCVATDLGDTGDIVGDTGIVVPPRDPAALAAGWKHLAALEPQTRQALGHRARQRVVERYAIGEMHRRYSNLYSEVAGRPEG